VKPPPSRAMPGGDATEPGPGKEIGVGLVAAERDQIRVARALDDLGDQGAHRDGRRAGRGAGRGGSGGSGRWKRT